MNGSMVLLSLFFSVVLSEFVDPDESPPAQTPIRAHRLRPHHKRDTGQSCGTEICPSNTIFVYYRCNRSGENKCHWYLRMWTMEVRGTRVLCGWQKQTTRANMQSPSSLCPRRPRAAPPLVYFRLKNVGSRLFLSVFYSSIHEEEQKSNLLFSALFSEWCSSKPHSHASFRSFVAYAVDTKCSEIKRIDSLPGRMRSRNRTTGADH
ncbi:hypothetical protein Y032_0002g1107 [Ancylostoma ceylanicum]|uniref:Secreted protein n=1 Tax=Ancylostoma ceylanicum TaxID=53326 RepID=A0A016W1B0_9BILA|nr:hypothetical protein Y032_0002g1107 [Ancylostoma ceylanicum]